MIQNRHLEVLSFIVNQETKVGQLQVLLLDEEAEKYGDEITRQLAHGFQVEVVYPYKGTWYAKQIPKMDRPSEEELKKWSKSQKELLDMHEHWKDAEGALVFTKETSDPQKEVTMIFRPLYKRPENYNERLEKHTGRRFLSNLSPKAIREIMAFDKTPIVKSWLQKILKELLEEKYIIKHEINSRRIYFTVNQNKLVKDFLEYTWGTCFRSENNKPYPTEKDRDKGLYDHSLTPDLIDYMKIIKYRIKNPEWEITSKDSHKFKSEELDELGVMLLASLRTFWVCKYRADTTNASSMSNIYTEILYQIFEDWKEQTHFMKSILQQEKKKKDFINLHLDVKMGIGDSELKAEYDLIETVPIDDKDIDPEGKGKGKTIRD